MSGGAIAGIVIGVVVLLAVVCGGGAFAITTLGKTDPSPTTAPTSVRSTGAPSVSPSEADSPSPSGSETDSGVSNVQDVLAGECVKDNPQDSNSLLPAACSEAKSYKVVKRFEETTDRTKCTGTGADTSYYWDNYSDDAKDFVLCLKKN
jgi:hypothetical protein